MYVASGEPQPPTIGSSKGGVMLLVAAPALNMWVKSVSLVVRALVGAFPVEAAVPATARTKIEISNNLIFMISPLG